MQPGYMQGEQVCKQYTIKRPVVSVQHTAAGAQAHACCALHDSVSFSRDRSWSRQLIFPPLVHPQH